MSSQKPEGIQGQLRWRRSELKGTGRPCDKVQSPCEPHSRTNITNRNTRGDRVKEAPCLCEQWAWTSRRSCPSPRAPAAGDRAHHCPRMSAGPGGRIASPMHALGLQAALEGAWALQSPAQRLAKDSVWAPVRARAHTDARTQEDARARCDCAVRAPPARARARVIPAPADS